MIKEILLKLFFQLIKGYGIFFFDGDIAYYVDDIMIDTEMKEIVLKSKMRGGGRLNEY